MNRTRRQPSQLHGWAAMLALLSLAACAGAPRAPGVADGLTFVVVRHAEKAAVGGSDPALSAAGEARAVRLATLLADAPLVAIYSTGLQRTRQTVAPSAAAHGLEVRPYDPREPAAAFAARLRAAHRAGTVLVAGHSNTVPTIAAALCSCEVGAMPENRVRPDQYRAHRWRRPGAPGNEPLLTRLRAGRPRRIGRKRDLRSHWCVASSTRPWHGRGVYLAWTAR